MSPSRKKSSTGRKIGYLSSLLGESDASLRQWLKSTPSSYSYITFSIAKRSGGKRPIEAPNEDLKQLQKTIYKRLLKKAAVQTAANGFVPYRSLIHNVRPHLNSKVIIKIDLKDFFGSIKEESVYRYWLADGWNPECSQILARICCKDGHLPQGAPTSPALSNTVNRGWDGIMTGIIEDKYHARYTRYADDITISFPANHERVHSKIRPLLTEVRTAIENEGYRIQFDKGVKILRRHQRQIVTGLVLNEKINLPREIRHRIRAMQYLRKKGDLPDRELKKLEGYERLKYMVETSDEGKRSVRSKTFSTPTTVVHGDIVHGNKIGRDYYEADNSSNYMVTNNSIATPSSRHWSRGDKLAAIGIFVAVLLGALAFAAAVMVPEFRELFRLSPSK